MNTKRGIRWALLSVGLAGVVTAVTVAPGGATKTFKLFVERYVETDSPLLGHGERVFSFRRAGLADTNHFDQWFTSDFARGQRRRLADRD